MFIWLVFSGRRILHRCCLARRCSKAKDRMFTKELKRLLKMADINMSVDKVLAFAQSIVSIQLTLLQNNKAVSRTMLLKRHQGITPLFPYDFWGKH